MITAPINTSMMSIPIQPVSSQQHMVQHVAEREAQSPFSVFFDAALSVLQDTNRMQQDVYQAQLDFATGRLDDILAVQMAMDRASSALNFTVQVTNRIIESYREIMRMQL